MTGPQHYQEAERLLGDASRVDNIIVMANPQALAAAQVHATLALVMAIADPLGYGGRSDSQWTDVTP